MIYFPHLETNITNYCQNRCVSCNHLTPIATKRAHLDPAIIERDLAMASPLMHGGDFTLVGGEPTLHPQIMDIIRIVKASGIADGMVVYTNGQSMRHLTDDFYKEIDLLIVTPYKLGGEDRAFITGKCEKYGTALQWHTTEFTQSFHKTRHSDEEAAEIYRTCWFRHNRRVIEDGYFYRCCLSPFIPTLTGGKHDGLPLEGMTDARLLDYLNEPVPDICYICGSNIGVPIGWRECSREDWLKESVK